MVAYNVISADSHVFEPPNLFIDYIDPEFRSRAPRIIRQDGVDKWQMEGVPLRDIGLQSAAGQRPEEMKAEVQHADTRPGGWDPHERIKDMDLDHIDAEVLYTSLFPLYRLPDRAYQAACARAYNDWLADMCSVYPDRLIGVGIIPIHMMDVALEELRRTAKAGLKGASLHSLPPDDRPFQDPYYEPFWAEAEAMGMPVSFHMFSGERRNKVSMNDRLVTYSTAPVEIQETLAVLIASGVLERYPKLKVVSVEADIGWMPNFLARLDHQYDTHRFHDNPDSPLTMRPSEYCRRQVYATFIDDAIGVENRHHIGVENIMWSSDYPHSNSTWPKSAQFIQSQFGGVPEEERRKMVCGNVAALYGIG
ncbi:MAG: amidohydrolase [Chloroflexi bacterium]|nr:amidohydrolase [Chloroflexota bacterium]MCH8283453.1 amidohydrolase [Chloroflexota bacterium]MCI0770180.1 amidohydrolase [Chloroflexota bacterium]